MNIIGDSYSLIERRWWIILCFCECDWECVWVRKWSECVSGWLSKCSEWVYKCVSEWVSVQGRRWLIWGGQAKQGQIFTKIPYRAYFLRELKFSNFAFLLLFVKKIMPQIDCGGAVRWAIFLTWPPQFHVRCMHWGRAMRDQWCTSPSRPACTRRGR